MFSEKLLLINSSSISATLDPNCGISTDSRVKVSYKIKINKLITINGFIKYFYMNMIISYDYV